MNPAKPQGNLIVMENNISSFCDEKSLSCPTSKILSNLIDYLNRDSFIALKLNKITLIIR